MIMRVKPNYESKKIRIYSLSLFFVRRGEGAATHRLHPKRRHWRHKPFKALINRCSQEVSNEDYYSAQEIMHHLPPLKLTSRSFNVVPINLNGPRRVKVNRTDADITTHDSILGTNSKCQKYVSDIMEMNVINFAKSFKVANDKLIN